MIERVEARIAGADHQYRLAVIIPGRAEIRRMDNSSGKALHAFPLRNERLAVAPGGHDDMVRAPWAGAGPQDPVIAAGYDLVHGDAERDRQPVCLGEFVEVADDGSSVRKAGRAGGVGDTRQRGKVAMRVEMQVLVPPVPGLGQPVSRSSTCTATPALTSACAAAARRRRRRSRSRRRRSPVRRSARFPPPCPSLS
ncbi:hypothetical protein AJ88_27765 [Mesorhizobium amorphae CCBAU 01583]|nr:hypothetical protein AJ88_27765 [Mesorhizobium amorphae CCBAU 01583]